MYAIIDLSSRDELGRAGVMGQPDIGRVISTHKTQGQAEVHERLLQRAVWNATGQANALQTLICEIRGPLIPPPGTMLNTMNVMMSESEYRKLGDPRPITRVEI